MLLKYCMLCFGEQPCTNPSFTTIAAGHSGTEKPKEKRCKQNPSGELVSMFQALVLLSPVPAGQPGVPGAAQALVSQPSLACSPGRGPCLSAARVLSSVGTVSVVKGFKALKCTSVSANTPLGALTPLEPLESSSLRLYLFIPVQPCTANKGRAEISSFLSDSSFLKPRKLPCKTCWLLLSSFAGGEMNL